MLKRFLGRALLLLFPIFISRAQIPHPGRLLLTEVYYDTPYADAEEEWIELFNPESSTADLSRYKVGDEESRGGQEGMVRFPVGSELGPGQAIVVAQTATGFRLLFGSAPDYEIKDTDADVPDMIRYEAWASGSFALANDGDELLLLDAQDFIVDAINYGDSRRLFSPSINDVFTGQSLERLPGDCDTDSALEWHPQSHPTPGEVSLDGTCPQGAGILRTDRVLPIGSVQGVSDSTPLMNQIVTVRGIVTGIREERNASGTIFNTFYLQNRSEDADGDPQSSDGIAVFTALQRPLVKVGDEVRVTGTVTEFYGLTEIIDPIVTPVSPDGQLPLPAAVALFPPIDALAYGSYLEEYEGMLVTLEQAVTVVGPTHSGCGFAVASPSSNLQRIFQRGIATGESHVIPILHDTNVICESFPKVKTGDLVSGLAGPLTYHFDRFKIVNQETGTLIVVPTQTKATIPGPTLAANQFSIATFNLENHFDSVDDTGTDDEPKPDSSQVELKRHKLIQALATSLACPTIVGVQEVENAALLTELAVAAADLCGFTYQVTHLESVDSRGIDVAMLTHPSLATVLEVTPRQACSPIRTGVIDASVSCQENWEPLFSRPPLQITVELGGETYTFLVNHFKSKREGESETAERRLAQAQFVNSLVGEYVAIDEKARVVVLGDFNDFELSAPMLAMTTNGGRLRNVLLDVTDDQRYTVIFDGESQLVDGILLSPSLVADVARVMILHVNADQPYTSASDASPRGIGLRSSDHDLPLVIMGYPRPAVGPTIPEPTAMATAAVAASPTIDASADMRPDASAGPGAVRPTATAAAFVTTPVGTPPAVRLGDGEQPTRESQAGEELEQSGKDPRPMIAIPLLITIIAIGGLAYLLRAVYRTI